MPAHIEIIDLSVPVPYADMLATQHTRQSAVQRGESPNTLYLLEHPPTITLGRNTNSANLLLTPEQYTAEGITLIEADRGGDVTYHGPGQLVAYPILDLRQWTPSVGWYLRKLEQCLITLLAQYGLQAQRMEGHTGVWVNGAKVAAIGVGVRNWVTCHGIALNIAPDMRHFTYIIPCGIADKPVTSLAQLLQAPPQPADVKKDFIRIFGETFEAGSIS